jgi:Bacterial Ig domain/IPT/TIG domain
MYPYARWLGACLTGALLMSTVALTGGATTALAALPAKAVLSNSSGEIEHLFLNDPTDPWSAGEIVVGGQRITLPRNLLIDLPANRLSLTQLFAQAPSTCTAAGESGLAKADACNATGTGGFATVTANRTKSGRVIAGDVFVEKGLDVSSGVVTYVNHTDGYYRLNGNLNDPNSGAMVRLNDPAGRHTVQQGAGCAAGSSNCSADPRFMLDPDNYVNVFSTGYPYCIPSTTPRTFTDTLDLNSNLSTTDSMTTRSSATGTGDALCPDTNRTADQVSPDSRRFAPIQIGDSVSAEGNFETVGGVRFLSAHTSKISVALETRSSAGQPDYMYIDEMFMDAPAFYRSRARDLFLGSTTAPDSDVAIWTIHRDTTNVAHEFPLGSVVGCENSAGALQCRRVLGPHTFRIRHDVDFLGKNDPKLNPCVQINADSRFAGRGICPQGGTPTDLFGMMSPLPHEVQARTGVEMADLARAGGPQLKSIDIQGAPATHGQYLFPMAIGLGGIETPNFAEIDINLLNTPTGFSGLPWTLDRRLSPTGCLDTGCESVPQPLDPYPFEGFDPRAPGIAVPAGTYDDANFTASPLTNERDRMLSYVDPTLDNFNGDSTVLAWPPVDPPALPVLPTPPLNGTNVAPIANDDDATIAADSAQPVTVLANDVQVDDPINVTTVQVGAAPAHGSAAANPDGTVTYTPATGYFGPDSFTYTVQDGLGATSNVATAHLTVAAPLGPPPTVAGFSPATGLVGATVTITGTQLDVVTSVTFGGASQSVFTSQSATQIVTTVPANAVNGPLAVLSSNGTATTASAFTVTPSTPSLSGFTPPSGITGDPVTLTGTLFTGATSVSFGGVAQGTLTVVSPTQITTTVPPGAVTGPLTVTTPGGTSTPTAATFTVGTVHAITGLTPSSGVVGTEVAITGTGLNGLKPGDVTFTGASGRVAASFVAVDAGRVVAVVPANAVTGPVAVSTGGNVATSRVSFTVNAPVPNTPVPAAPAPTAPVPTTGPPIPGSPQLPLAVSPSAPTLTLAQPLVTQGLGAVVTGTAPAGSRVTLLASPAGSTAFRPARSTVTNPGGRWSMTLRLRTNARVYVQVENGPATSPTLVRVRAGVSVRATRNGPHQVRLTGTATPRRAGIVVTAYRKTATGAVRLGSARTTAHGAFSLTSRIAGPTATVFVQTRSDLRNASGRSANHTVRTG